MNSTTDGTALLAKRQRVRELLDAADPDHIKNVCLALSALSMSLAHSAALDALSPATR